MSTHNICLSKVDKKYNGCKTETTELIDCGLIGVCAVIRSNTVYITYPFSLIDQNNYFSDSVDPDETAGKGLSHQDLHFFCM